jgi:hypothetical protein
MFTGLYVQTETTFCEIPLNYMDFYDTEFRMIPRNFY